MKYRSKPRTNFTFIKHINRIERLDMVVLAFITLIDSLITILSIGTIDAEYSDHYVFYGNPDPTTVKEVGQKLLDTIKRKVYEPE